MFAILKPNKPYLASSHTHTHTLSLSLSLSEEDNPLTNPNNKHGFTLIELIVVVIIVGILAAVGLSQYSLTVEKSRIAEAKVRISAMRQLAQEYYWNNGAMDGIQLSDLGVSSSSCASTDYYAYSLPYLTSSMVQIYATRCTSGGKTPNVSTQYIFYLNFYPATGNYNFHCYYPPDDNAACFGYPGHV